ncbi:hypothetical protein T4A_1072, partial [Trichinella pseudospiralis]
MPESGILSDFSKNHRLRDIGNLHTLEKYLTSC